MRLLLIINLFITVFLVSLSSARSITHYRRSNLLLRQLSPLVQQTDKLLFSDSLAAFQEAAAARSPAQLDWQTDGCTKAPDHPLGINFLPACYRHDFGYNNYRKQKRFTKAGKDKIDSNFKKDLYELCGKLGKVKKGACDKVADIYHVAVSMHCRKIGGARCQNGT